MTHTFLRVVLSASVLSLFTTAPAIAGESPGRKLDESLVQALRQGCGTRRVIIRAVAGSRGGLSSSLEAHGNTVWSQHPSINAIAADVHCHDLTVMEGLSSVLSISVDARVTTDGARASATSTHASTLAGKRAAAAAQETLFQTLGVRKGRGTPGVGSDEGAEAIGVAVIDSGIAPGADFENRITAFYDFTNGRFRATVASDAYGHGTHVAGLIGSTFVGVAPAARLIGLKVLDQNGQGRTSDVLRALEFAVANKDALGIQVINLSLGHPVFEPAATDPLVQAVEQAVRAGLVVVASAGNVGINPQTGQPGYAGITSPGNAPSVLSVGAVRTFDTVTRLDDRVAPYSSRGPSWYDGFAKPDVVAPGDNLLSVAAAKSKLRTIMEGRGNTGDYMRLSGTSMAAAVASGVTALVLNANPGLTPNALKAVLEFSAFPAEDDHGVFYDALTQGVGSVNGAGAITLARLIDPSQPVGARWLTAGLPPYTVIGGEPLRWAQQMVWGTHVARGTGVIDENRPAWALSIVWGDATGDDNIVWGNLDDDNIVWGNAFDAGDNIVWGNNIVWADSWDEGDNIVWGNFFDDNIVWGNNVVWGNALVGMGWDDDNIVWGNVEGDNIVWGNLADDNIVWGNLFDDDNIVWGNSDDDNIVWGNNVIWGNSVPWGGGTVKGTAEAHRARRTRVEGGL